MTVTQYIGARYVPIFSNPIEWSNETSYEPLTIVIHNGNSYTSRQFVPIGIDIENDEYWALTGNYNAQVASYREEVLRVVADMEDVETLVGNMETTVESLPPYNATALFNVVKYGADNTGATDSYAAIMDAAEAADGIGSLYFPDGIYAISDELDLTSYDVHSIYGNGCTLVPYGNASLDYMIWPFVDTTYFHKGHFHEICGINFNGKTSCSAAIRTSQQMVIKDCNFTNFVDYCITNGNDTTDGQGIRICDCLFVNDIVESVLYNNCIAIKATYDCAFENLRFMGYKRAIEIEGGHNQLTDCYFWSRSARFETFGIYSNSFSQDIEFVNCYWDHINTPCYKCGFSFVGCIFLDGYGDSNDYDSYLIQWPTPTGAVVAAYIGCRFSWGTTKLKSKCKICNNPRLSMHTIACVKNDYWPVNNLLGNLNKSFVIDDTMKRTVGSTMPTANKWYRFAHANKQANVSDGAHWTVAFEIGLANTGRNITVQKVSNRSTFGYNELIEGYSLRQLGAIGVIQSATEMDFYFKPSDALVNTEFIIYNVWGGNNVNALWLDFAETNYADGDMTAIIAQDV